jgi:hypothetical protein
MGYDFRLSCPVLATLTAATITTITVEAGLCV